MSLHKNNKVLNDVNNELEIIYKLKFFIDDLGEYADNYHIETKNIEDIYEILQSDNMKFIIDEDYEQLTNLINYHKKIYNKIISSITYEDICKIIEKYLMISSEDNEKSLLYDITQNLLKININQIKKVIYKTSPRLLIRPEQVLIDMMFEEEVSNNYLIKTIKWLKKNNTYE